MEFQETQPHDWYWEFVSAKSSLYLEIQDMRQARKLGVTRGEPLERFGIGTTLNSTHRIKVIGILVDNNILDKETAANQVGQYWSAMIAGADAAMVELTKRSIERNKLRQTMRMDYREAAAHFLELQPLWYDRHQLWWQWNHKTTCWELTDETDIMRAFDNDTDMPDTISGSERDKIKESLRRAARGNEPTPLPPHIIQFNNTLINIETGEQQPAQPQLFATNPIPWTIGTDTATPNIDKLFTEWVGTEQAIKLYEIAAFCLVPQYFLHRIFAFTGRGSNGKSKYLSIIKKLVGERNTCAGDLEEINSRFGSARVYKKLVCLMGETNFNTLRNTNKLKQLSGEDNVGFEFKNKTPFDAVNYAKLLISTNTLPATEDTTDGFFRRWDIIDFPNQFQEDTDILRTIPEVEYNALANKCISIAMRLWKERRFTNQGSIEERRQRYEERSTPLIRWLKEYCIQDVNGYIFKFEVRNQLKAFCKTHGFREPTDIDTGRQMIKLGYEAGSKPAEWSTTSDGRLPCFLGIRLRGLNETDSQQTLNVPNTESISNVLCEMCEMGGIIPLAIPYTEAKSVPPTHPTHPTRSVEKCILVATIGASTNCVTNTNCTGTNTNGTNTNGVNLVSSEIDRVITNDSRIVGYENCNIDVTKHSLQNNVEDVKLVIITATHMMPKFKDELQSLMSNDLHPTLDTALQQLLSSGDIIEVSPERYKKV